MFDTYWGDTINKITLLRSKTAYSNYQLKDALDNGEDITIFLDKNKFKSKDVFLTTMYNVLVADYIYLTSN